MSTVNSPSVIRTKVARISKAADAVLQERARRNNTSVADELDKLLGLEEKQLERLRHKGVPVSSHPITYRRVEALACKHLSTWPINCKACWVCGVSIKGFKAKSMEVTIIGTPTMGVMVRVHRPLWKRVLVGIILRKYDVWLFPYPYWTEAPVKVKAETRDGKAVQIGLIVVDGGWTTT